MRTWGINVPAHVKLPQGLVRVMLLWPILESCLQEPRQALQSMRSCAAESQGEKVQSDPKLWRLGTGDVVDTGRREHKPRRQYRAWAQDSFGLFEVLSRRV